MDFISVRKYLYLCLRFLALMWHCIVVSLVECRSLGQCILVKCASVTIFNVVWTPGHVSAVVREGVGGEGGELEEKGRKLHPVLTLYTLTYTYVCTYLVCNANVAW